jgi:hypothetical protein
MNAYYGHMLKIVNKEAIGCTPSATGYTQLPSHSERGIQSIAGQEAAQESADYGPKDFYRAKERGQRAVGRI